MICNAWFQQGRSAVSVGVMGVLASTSLLSAQTGQLFNYHPVSSPISAPPAFVAAPSLSLNYAPTAIALGHLTASGYSDVVTADYNSGTITVFTGNGRGSFAAGVAYTSGAQPSALAIADVDGDGKADVIVANQSDGVISVLRGNGDGTLQPRKTYPVGFSPALLTTGDFTGQGRVDVVVAAASGATLGLLQNDGTGNLKSALNFALSGQAVALASADLNRDGRLDVAVANASGTVSILLGSGNGQFSALPDIQVATGALSSIVVGDFNRDGSPDLAVTSSTQNQVAVLLGKGDGTYAAPSFSAVGVSPVSAHVTDVDGDGIPDLVVVNKGSNTFSVLGGLGDGSFKPALNFVVGNAPLAGVAADFYGSGHVDVATIDNLSRTISVPAGNGDGTFIAGRTYAAGSQPISVASGDLDGNGTPDLVVANYCGTDASCGGSGSAAVLLASAAGTYQLSSTYSMGAGSVSVALADVNGDKKLDLIALNRVDKTLSIRFGAGDGTFGSINTISLSTSPLALAAADLNHDGKMDLAVLADCGSATCSQPGQVDVLLGSGSGNFATGAAYATGYAPVALAIGATRTGGNSDILIANRCGHDATCASGGTATVLLGDGTGAFKSGTEVALGNSPSSIALADLRGTGNVDLVTSRSTDNTVAVLPGNGDGTFGTAATYSVGTSPGALTIADFNGDGKPDIAVANTADSTVSVLYGTTTGTLQSAASVPVSTWPTALAAISSTTKSAASLATVNGTVSTASVGSNVTVLANLRPQPMVVGSTSSTVTLTSGTNPAIVNAGFTLTATVSGASGTPTGSVVFNNGATPLSDCGGSTGVTLDGSGVATCTVSSLGVSSYSISAAYGGDTTYNISTSNTVSQVVNHASPTLTLTAGTTTQVNAQATFTATLGNATFSPNNPTGTVTFSEGATTICTGNVNASGVANCSTSSLALGSHTITATYVGDTNFAGASAGSSITQTIIKATPNLTLSPGTTTNVNSQATFTANLGNVNFTPTAPTGLVTFSEGASTVCTGSVDSIGVATCNTSSLSAGSHTISVTYAGDSNFAGASTASSITQTVNKANVTVSLSPGGTSNLNASASFTATLGGTLTPTGPTGTVDFVSGANTICSGTVNSTTGVATCSTNTLTAGTHSISANYLGDSNFASASTTSSITQTVNQATPTLTLNPGTTTNVNANATFTATMSGVTFTPNGPAGTVTFSSGGSTICTGAINSSTGVATCSTNALTAGTHSVTASYPGDTNFGAASAAAITQTVQAASASLGITVTPGSSVGAGTAVTFTATLSGASFTPTAPSGTVTWLINNAASADCPPATINASHQSTCITQSLVVPADTISASYSGDSNFTVSGATVTETINKANPTVALVASPSPGSVNQAITFTATVPSPSGGTPSVFPTGNITFKQGSTTICTGPVVLGSTYPPTASCSYAFSSAVPSPGAPVTATYSGDANFTAGTAGGVSEIVNASGTTTTVISSGSSAVNQAATFTATITPAFSGTAIPQGTVVFTNTSATPAATLCSVTVASNGTVPTCSSTFAAAGSFSITATFTPNDSNFAASTSAPITQVVNAGSTGLNLVTSATPTSVNQQVTFTASFNPAISGTQPQGTMTYSDGAATLCSATVNAGVVPTCTTAFTKAGAHSISAAFTSSNSNFTSVSSNPITQTVNQAGTTTTLTSSNLNSSVNQAVVFTATVAPAITGGAAPTGTVTFNASLGSQNLVLCGTPQNLTTAGSVTTASCSASLPSNGSWSITAIYNADSNFTAATSAPIIQSVGKAGVTLTGIPATASSQINGSLTFTANVASTIAGSTLPGGTVTFTDGAATLCGGAVAIAASGSTGVVSASCAETFASAGLHTITVTYSGDANFGGSSTTSVVTVGASATTLVLSSSSPTTKATQPVTFTALITPAQKGASAPTGTVAFSSTDGSVTAACSSVPVVQRNDGTSIASCPVSLPHNPALPGQVTVTAAYAPDLNAGGVVNFGNSSGTTSETIQDFNVTFSVTPLTSSTNNQSSSKAVYVTQGYANSTDASTTPPTLADPFNPATITVAVASSASFNDVLSASCVVVSKTTNAAVSDPSCKLSSTTPAGANGTSLTYLVLASAKAPVDSYAVTLTFVDQSLNTLSQTTAPLTVSVLPTSASVTLGTGGATATESAQFFSSTPITGTLTISCPQVWDAVKMQMLSNTNNSLLTCTGPAGAVTTVGGITTVPITISTGGSTASLPQRSGSLYLAGVVGLPMFALFTWAGAGRSRRKSLFRLFSILMIALGISLATGCGGSFNRPTTPPATGISAGSYLVEVIVTDSSGNKFYSQVPLVVNSQ